MNEFSGKKTVVTGGAGFIGSALVRYLSDAGAEVHVVDNLVNGKKENLQDVVHTLHTVDIRDESALSAILKNTDIVFHLACLGVRHSINNPIESHEVNASATLSLLQTCRELNISRFVYTSTSEVYGTARTVPMNEEHPTFPMTVYGAAKLAGECYARAYWETYGYPTTMVRPFNAYGPRCHHEGDSGEVIPKFLLRAKAGREMVVFGDGKQTRDFTFVEDTARGIAAAALRNEAIGQTINLGSGKEITILELAHEISSLLDQDRPMIAFDEPRPGDVLRLYADAGKAEAMLGFKPTINLRDGLRQLKSWYEHSNKSVDALLAEERRHNWLTE